MGESHLPKQSYLLLWLLDEWICILKTNQTKTDSQFSLTISLYIPQSFFISVPSNQRRLQHISIWDFFHEYGFFHSSFGFIVENFTVFVCSQGRYNQKCVYIVF